MGGNTATSTPQSGDSQYTPQSKDLVYRSVAGDSPKDSSDSYTQNYFAGRDAEMKKLMDALARLGIVPQAMQSGFVPNPPYRLPEQQIGF